MTLNFNSNWNINKYKNSFESEEHWNLKNQFLLTHKDKYPEKRLICLAQTFFNIEILGCKYPAPLMNLIKQLSKGIAIDYRDLKKSRLQRTFVKASDAASDKVKRLKRDYNSAGSTIETTSLISKKPKFISFVKEDERSNSVLNNQTHNASFSKQSINFVDSSSKPDAFTHCSNKQFSNFCTVSPDTKKRSSMGELYENMLRNGDRLQQLCIIYREFQTTKDLKCSVLLNQLLQSQGINFEISTKFVANRFKVSYMIEGITKPLASAVHSIQNEAKALAAKNALMRLSKLCFCIKVNTHASSGSLMNHNSEKLSNKVSDDNMGNKLLRMMGWTGGGLGKTESGITEPVVPTTVIGRKGLGASTGNFMNGIKKIIDDYVKNMSTENLKFSSEFSSEQRKMIHFYAQKYKNVLKSKSFGKGDDRTLTISRKLNCNLIRDLIRSKSNDYDLATPGSYTIEFGMDDTGAEYVSNIHF